MSFSRYNHAAAVVDGKIYAIGGIGSEGESIDSVEMYDPLADSWQQVARMPQARILVPQLQS
ncbi:Kelch motif protein [compost metagenome]